MGSTNVAATETDVREQAEGQLDGLGEESLIEEISIDGMCGVY